MPLHDMSGPVPIDEYHGKTDCLVDAPDVDAANTVHRKAHRLVADEIFPVQEGL